jgi:acyl carrier protein phosphodiesterase
MINGTLDLDAALSSLKHVLDIVEEEKMSIDYTHDHASLTGKVLSDRLPIQDIVEYAQTIRESTSESKEDITKVLTIMSMTAKILEHYVKLSEIGDVWRGIIDKNVDDLRMYT